MINIEYCQVITYGNNQSVTVYRDDTDTNKWYIVPLPVIPLNDSGVPEFSLVQYNGDQGQVSGTCAFQTELAVSPAILQAVQAKLGAGITIGQFDWQSVKVWFSFVTADGPLQLIATPSMYGSNRASFIVSLPDAKTVNDFINAFGPSGSAGGTFTLRYDVTALTKLPPAVVTVTFNSNTAYQYQKTVQTTTNCWGSVTSTSTTIHENLSQSEAGKIEVDPGSRVLDAATRQRLQDWGNATLENDVNDAVSQAMKTIGTNNADNFSMSQVASFKNIYQEDQVVPWIITPESPIPAFTSEQWAKIFSTVSNQSLAVAFTVQDLPANNVESVTLVVTYPTQTTNNTYQFVPKGPGTWIFQAPGNVVGNKYDPTYQYQYTVHYAGVAPYQSPVITSTDTEVYLNAGDLNVLSVTFDATNVNFDDGSNVSVSYLLIDFYFVNQADGKLVQDQQAKLDATTTTCTFSSRTALPFKNDYLYRLTYMLSGGQQYTVDWQSDNVAGPTKGQGAKAPTVTLPAPTQPITIMVNPIDPPSGSYSMIELMVRYSDPINKLNEQHPWRITPTEPPDMWTFQAPANQNGQIVQFQGEYIIGGKQHMIQSAKISDVFINISATQETFSVLVDPSQIEWPAGNITQAVINIYTKTTGGAQTNIGATTFTPKNTNKWLYNFLFDTGTTPTYYYTLDYWIQNQPKPNSVGETEVAGKGILTLPGKI